jgi:ATP-binding cassette subfamily B protein/subfamily B ATP-binding cassette protein MsbA
MVLEPLKMIACLAGAAMISWRLLAVSLIVAPLAGYVMVRLAKSLKKANRKSMEEMAQLFTRLAESIAGIQSVKAFSMERYERRQFHQGGKKCYSKAMRIMLFNALGRATGEFMGMGIICMAILVGAYLVSQQKTSILGIPIMDKPLSLGALMAFYALLAGASDPARKLAEVMNPLQRGLAASDRIYEVLDREPTIVDPKEPKTLYNPRPELVFENLSFHYVPDKPVLRHLNLRIPFGETVALVGPNGCGKTTLASLLLRFYDPVAGAVKLDGIDLRELRMRDIRQMTGLVAQQAVLFDDTVRNNIRYGSPNASDDEVTAAAEKAFAHRFIVEKLQDGYDTIVGERGGKLSGGQRQRVLLARAILRDPKFLILDEATSQIDLESEQLIHKVLEQFVRNRTTLLITHRMSSIALANRIIVMDAGQIIDCGSHDELVRRCGLYQRLHDLGFRQTA